MISVRIYNNGDTVINNVRPEDVKQHIEYNTTFRFGCALVVDGEIKNEGYLSEKRIRSIMSTLSFDSYKDYTPYPYN